MTIFIIIFSIIHIVYIVKVHVNILESIYKITGGSLEGREVAIGMSEAVVSLFVIIYALLSMIFTTGLCVYHMTLINGNLTTKEELKNVYGNIFGNPYNRGFWKNVRLAFFAPMPKKPLLEVMYEKELGRIRSSKGNLEMGAGIVNDRSKLVSVDILIYFYDVIFKYVDIFYIYSMLMRSIRDLARMRSIKINAWSRKI